MGLPPLARGDCRLAAVAGFCVGLLASASFAGAQAAADATGGNRAGIVLKQVWMQSRVGGGGKGKIFLVACNSGGAADRLVGVEVPAAGVSRLVDAEGKAIESAHIPVEGGLSLNQKGAHIAVEQAKEPFGPAGKEIDVKLRFERAGVVTGRATVRFHPPLKAAKCDEKPKPTS